MAGIIVIFVINDKKLSSYMARSVNTLTPQIKKSFL